MHAIDQVVKVGRWDKLRLLHLNRVWRRDPQSVDLQWFDGGFRRMWHAFVSHGMIRNAISILRKSDDNSLPNCEQMLDPTQVTMGPTKIRRIEMPMFDCLARQQVVLFSYCPSIQKFNALIPLMGKGWKGYTWAHHFFARSCVIFSLRATGQSQQDKILSSCNMWLVPLGCGRGTSQKDYHIGVLLTTCQYISCLVHTTHGPAIRM